MSVGGGYSPPSNGAGTGGTDDQQLNRIGDSLVLEDGGATIDLSDLVPMDATDVFGNPL